MSALAISSDHLSNLDAEETLVPPPPETMEDTGLSSSLIEHLIFKMLYFRGDMLGRDLASAIGLKFSLIDDLVESLKRQHLLQVKRSLGLGNTSALFSLTDEGRTVVRECLESNQYSGPAPVPLFQYSYFVRQQRRRDGWLTPKDLATAYSRMVVTDKLLSQIGPAVSSGNSFLIYGQPGNGKTYLAEALQQVDASEIYVPYAIESQGNIVQVYDPNYHHAVKDDDTPSVFTFQPQHDGRWIKCRRPFIVTGGELTLEMLDLNYNKASKIYDAPYQLKANNGIYLIDDFGRQKCTPAEVLNRWIVPMERRMDFLTFLSGGKMTVPFETFLIFSTNLKPDQLGDEAFLRRIQYKMLLRSPDEVEFIQIFRRFCESKKLPYQEDLPNKFVSRHYHATGKKFRRCHPRDVISHAIDLMHFEKLPFRLTDDVLLRAFESCFTEEVE